MDRGTNRQITLASRPEGPLDITNFTMREVPVPSPSAGELLIRTVYLSIDPYLRPAISDPQMTSIGWVVPGDAVGQVVVSCHPWFKRGDFVQGMLGWQDYVAAPPYILRKVDPSVAPVSTALGILGASGLTAYFGLVDVARAAPGETVTISAAAGAVGSAAVQLAKLIGCRVIGITSSEEKMRYLLDDLGADAAFNYNAGDGWHERLGVECPFGIDVYFDNVGGPVSDAVFRYLSVGARVAVCGQISDYDPLPPAGPRLLSQILHSRARVAGFLATDFSMRSGEALWWLAACFRAGLLRNRESIEEGLENAPRALVGLLAGRNIGKQLVKVA